VNIGYACLVLGVRNTEMKSCMLKNASEERLLEIIRYNLDSLENIVDYNIKNDILLFRISSDLIPFGSSPVNRLDWDEIFADKFRSIGRKIKNSGMRVSMHPGQYTVLNSPHTVIVEKAMEDLNYHRRVLDALQTGPENKIILHIGGMYSDKREALKRFAQNFTSLDQEVRDRLVVENDHKVFNIHDVLEIGTTLNIPVVFDNLHNEVNPYPGDISEKYWISQCRATWRSRDGSQKLHYSQQDPVKRPGSHSGTIAISSFMEFCSRLEEQDVDMMLEVKDKNISAIKCINAVSRDKKIKYLELEWSRYKYSVLENSPAIYLEIRKLLNNKQDYPVIRFYNLIEEAMKTEKNKGNSVNAMQHVWGYFKDSASDTEKKRFLKLLQDLEKGQAASAAVRSYLCRMALKYDEKYLLDSYYFIL